MTAGHHPRELHQGLRELVDRARSVDVRPYEDTPGSTPGFLVQQVIELSKDGLDLCLSIAESYERSENVWPRAADAVRRDDARQKVSDVATVGSMELREKISRISPQLVDDSAGPSRLVLLSESLRKLFKVVAAVEHELCTCEGWAQHLSAPEDLQLSLRIRGAYTDFRHHMRSLGPAEGEAIENNLIAAEQAIEALLGSDLFFHLRIADRLEFRRLRWRVLGWLRFQLKRDPEAGQRLWQDVIGFAELLSGINNRSELVSHDRGLWLEMRECLDDPARAGRGLDRELRQRAGALKGRSDRIDALLRAGDNGVQAWSEAVDELETVLQITGMEMELLRASLA